MHFFLLKQLLNLKQRKTKQSKTKQSKIKKEQKNKDMKKTKQNKTNHTKMGLSMARAIRIVDKSLIDL